MFEDNKRLFVRITHSERYSAVYSERSEESNFYNIDNYHKYFGWLQQCLKIIKDSSFVLMFEDNKRLFVRITHSERHSAVYSERSEESIEK